MSTPAELRKLGAALISEGHIDVDAFLKKTKSEQHKLLWQWATSKQMDFQEWKPYLEAHCKGDAQ